MVGQSAGADWLTKQMDLALLTTPRVAAWLTMFCRQAHTVREFSSKAARICWRRLVGESSSVPNTDVYSADHCAGFFLAGMGTGFDLIGQTAGCCLVVERIGLHLAAKCTGIYLADRYACFQSTC